MNCVQKGCYRDKRITNMVEQCGALNTRQIAALVFKDIKTGERKAQQRLQKLHERGLLQRRRVAVDEPYIYYLRKPSGVLDHLVAVNWIFTWFVSKMSPWEVLTEWEYEQQYGILQCDAFAAIKNTATGEYKFWFVELDRAERRWDKTVVYNKLYSTNGYAGSWWVRHTKKFPGILCVASTPKRLKHIQRSIEMYNTAGLKFEARLLDDLIPEARACSKQTS